MNDITSRFITLLLRLTLTALVSLTLQTTSAGDSSESPPNFISKMLQAVAKALR
jgi:hypothetical protein